MPEQMEEITRILMTHLGKTSGERVQILGVGAQHMRLLRQCMPADWQLMNCAVRSDGRHALPRHRSKPYDAVIGLRALGRADNPFALVTQITRVLKPGGLMVVTAPWQWDGSPESARWRLLPSGMRTMLEMAGLTVAEAYIDDNACWGIARKPAESTSLARSGSNG